MPKATKSRNVPLAQSERVKAIKLLRETGNWPKDCDFYADLDHYLVGENPDFIVFKLGNAKRYRYAGIEPGDVVVVNPNIKETAEKTGIILSVVTNDRNFADYCEFEPEEDFGAGDILDVEYLYPEESEGTTRRAKKGDVPGVNRNVIGIVTHIIREVGK